MTRVAHFESQPGVQSIVAMEESATVLVERLKINPRPENLPNPQTLKLSVEKCQMPQRLGGAILAVLAVVLGIYSGVDSWPWWLTALFSLLSLSGMIFMLLPYDTKTSEVAEKSTAFIRGDASGSSLDTIYSDADFMVDGKARETKFRNITHWTDHSRE